jgi:hypothetical protein
MTSPKTAALRALHDAGGLEAVDRGCAPLLLPANGERSTLGGGGLVAGPGTGDASASEGVACAAWGSALRRRACCRCLQWWGQRLWGGRAEAAGGARRRWLCVGWLGVGACSDQVQLRASMEGKKRLTRQTQLSLERIAKRVS